MAENLNEDYFFYKNMIPFPAVVDGRLNVIAFLEAASNLVCLVGKHFKLFNTFIVHSPININKNPITDRLGTVFAPVKYDMQGNIEVCNIYNITLSVYVINSFCFIQSY